MRLNKKAQYGPDIIVAIVVVLLVGLGGVIFLNIFVGGLSMQGMLNILDTESDQKCFNMLIAMVGDEYVNTGEDVSSINYFSNLSQYYGGSQSGTFRSLRFESRMDKFNDTIRYFTLSPGGVEDMYYYLTSRQNAKTLRDAFATQHPTDFDKYVFCSMPVFGAYDTGVAELFLRISE